jgi:sulfate/thiosulfate transport system permease protein
MFFTFRNRWGASSINSPIIKRQQASRADRVNLGIALGYIGLMVALPILAISARAGGEGLGRLWQDVVQQDALFSLRLTFLMAFIMVILNSVTGTAMAWVLVRYRFPGQSLINALIDLPFAIPTIVTGLMLVALYGPQSSIGTFLTSHGVEVIYAKPGIVLALLFVTFPFVVRSVQPVLMEMDRDMEEAAVTLGAKRWRVFSRVVLPSILPAVLTGAGQAFSRALGEFGSVVMVAGNIPMKTQVAPVFIYGEIESYNARGALGVSMVLLASSFVILLLMNLIQSWGRRNDV